MDIIMPEMGGIEAVKEITNFDPQARVLMCSAMGQQALVAEAIQAGAKSFVVKPFQPSRVLEAVQRVLQVSEHERYADLFRAEARERLAEMNTSLLALERGEGAERVAELFRAAVHTVKGMSAAMGYIPVRDLSHAHKPFSICSGASHCR